MFRAVRVPVLGIIGKMSDFVPEGKTKHYVFGQGGGRQMAEQTGVPFLGEVPIDPRVTECGDGGEPIVHRHKDSPVAQALLKLADTVGEQAIAAQDIEQLPEVEL